MKRFKGPDGLQEDVFFLALGGKGVPHRQRDGALGGRIGWLVVAASKATRQKHRAHQSHHEHGSASLTLAVTSGHVPGKGMVD